MSGAQTTRATPAQEKALRGMLADFEAKAPRVTAAVVKRFVFWNALVTEVGALGFGEAELAQALGADLVQANHQADQTARVWCRVLVALESGEAQCVGLMNQGKLELATVVAGSVPNPVQAFPILFIVAATVLVGAFVILNNLSAGSRAESEAKRLHEETRKAAADACTMIAQQDPAAGQACLAALQKADAQAAAAAANPKGIMASLSNAVGALSNLVIAGTNAAASTASAAGSIAQSAGRAADWILWIGILWLFTREGKRLWS